MEQSLSESRSSKEHEEVRNQTTLLATPANSCNNRAALAHLLGYRGHRQMPSELRKGALDPGCPALACVVAGKQIADLVPRRSGANCLQKENRVGHATGCASTGKRQRELLAASCHKLGKRREQSHPVRNCLGMAEIVRCMASLRDEVLHQGSEQVNCPVA